MNTKLFKTTARSTMGDEVFSQFVDLLSSGVYKPGEKLPTEMEMCEELKVSSPVLREVIRALRYMGYLESVQGGGIYVCNPIKPALSEIKMKLAFEKTQLMSVWELRYVLETAMAGMAANRATDDEIADIWEAYTKYEENVKSEDNDSETISATQDFHSSVARAVHNDVLMHMLENVSNLLSMSRMVSIQVEGSSERAMDFHKRIALAIGDRNARRAKEVMKEHLLDVKSDLLISLERMDKHIKETEEKHPNET